MGCVEFEVGLELLPLLLGEHAVHETPGLGGAQDLVAFQRAQGAVDTDTRGQACTQVQIRRTELDHRREQGVEVQLVPHHDGLILLARLRLHHRGGERLIDPVQDFDRQRNVGRRGQARLDRPPGALGELLDCLLVGWILHGDDEAGAVDAHGHGSEPLAHVEGKHAAHHRRDRLLVRIPHGKLQLIGDGGHEIPLPDLAFSGQELGEGHACLGLAGQPFLQGVARQHLSGDQELPHDPRRRDHEKSFGRTETWL
jgi:hypothetical protein